MAVGGGLDRGGAWGLILALLLSLFVPVGAHAQDPVAEPGTLAVPERGVARGRVPRAARAADTYALWPARLDPLPYTVQPGDTLEGLGARFGLRASSLVWSNPALESAADRLAAGQILMIPPLDGAIHTVASGDTLEEIAAAYRVEPEIIAWYPANRISDPGAPLVAGRRLIIPGGQRAALPEAPELRAPAPSGDESSYFGWPTTGWITTRYGGRHRGIDIAGRSGSPIFATAAGKIVYQGWDLTGYGYMIVIDHGSGWRSRYAHLSGVYHEPGSTVEKGQLLATMGSTGRSSGPHLHFELIGRGWRVDPLLYLP